MYIQPELYSVQVADEGSSSSPPDQFGPERIHIAHAHLIKMAKHPTLTLNVNNFNLHMFSKISFQKIYFLTSKMERIIKWPNFESLNGAADSQFLQRFVCALQQNFPTDLFTEGSCMLTKIDFLPSLAI